MNSNVSGYYKSQDSSGSGECYVAVCIKCNGIDSWSVISKDWIELAEFYFYWHQ
jgi:hypothetical protein